MRHQKKGFKLGRTHAHRKATLASLAHALIAHKQITTTRAKARALRMYIEPLITRSKVDSTHNRREVFRLLQSKHAVKELFDEIAGQVGDRPGGYTRIVKLGQRAGDAAEMAIIELVDYNDEKPDGSDSSSGKRRTRRGGRRRGGAKTAAKPVADAVEDAVQEEEPEVAEEADETGAEAGDEENSENQPASDDDVDSEEEKE